MGLLDNDLSLLGLNILNSNYGKYGRLGPALTGGMTGYLNSKAAMRQQALKEQQAEQARAMQAQQAAMQKAKYQQQLEQYRQKKNAIAALPAGIRPYVQAGAMDAYNAIHPTPAQSYGNTPIFGRDAMGNMTVMRFGPGGTIVQPKLPEGVKPIKPFSYQDLGGGVAAIPYGSPNPTGYLPKTPKPEAMPEFKSDVKKAEELAKFKVEREKNRPKIERAAESALSKYQLVDDSIDKAINDAGIFTTGFIGSTTSDIAGTPAHDLSNTLNTIKSNIGFDKLQEMRDASPTGGALGQVSEMENKLLQSTWGSVEQSQSKEQLVENLNRLKQQIRESWKRIGDAYEKDYGVPLGMKLEGGQSTSSQSGDWQIKEIK